VAKVALCVGYFVTLVTFVVIKMFCNAMRIKQNHWLIFLLVLIVGISPSCRRELEPPEVENELLVPILKSKLDISKLVADSLLSADGDGFVSLVYRNTLYQASLDAFEELNTEEFEQSAKLQALELSDRTVQNFVSLGQIAENDSVYGPTIIALNGQTFQIPEITGLNFGPNVLDGSAYFDEMTLDSGYMKISIHNGFPTSISDIDFVIKNQGNQATIAQESFNVIQPGATATKTSDLAGKSIESYLEAFVENFDIDQSNGPVLLDTSDKITVTVTIGDLKVYSAIAVFPAQDIINVSKIDTLKNVGSSRITKAIAAKGFVNVIVESTIEDTLYFDYYIPEGKKNGLPFEVHERINPAPSGGSVYKEFHFDVSGYEFGMTGFPEKDSFNVLYSELVGRIDSTGRKVNITLEDSIRVFVNLSGFIPEYIEGYAGDTIINIGPTSVPIELFSKISSGTIEFEKVNMALSVSNGNNVPIDVKINALSASNSKTGKNVNINLSSIPSPISVLGASSVSVPWTNTWDLENSTENLNQVLGVFPDRFNVSMSVETNPGQNTSDLSQFGVDSNKLEAFADIEIPLSFIANDLLMRDTVSFNSKKIQKPEGIGSGTMYVIAKNSFPLTADMQLAFITTDGTIMQTLKFDKKVGAGALNAPNESVLAWEFDRADFDNMLSADQVVMTATVSAASTTQPTKIYSTMALDVQLSARFNYTYGSNE